MTTNHRILIVDDEPAVRKFLRNCLEGAGYHVIEAATGLAAVESTRKEHPDLLVLDLGLPDLEGIEVARLLREWCETPIVILSVRDQERDIVASLDAGADDYLTKPFGSNSSSLAPERPGRPKRPGLYLRPARGRPRFTDREGRG